jgi:alpha-D-xyloside xylohydrolase
MFGPAFLVCPVTQYKARRRAVLLPAGTDWYDFWTGWRFTGGQTVNADAPYDRIPIFVRAGSIIPMGPDQQYVGEIPARLITLQTYPGADGDFSLYEDDGGTYDYERGAFSRIDLHWDDSAGVFTIGARQGEFPGMLRERTFALAAAAKAVRYDGNPIQVRMEGK